MKVAFYAYPWAFQSPGGGEILLLKTKEALEQKGVHVKLFDQWQDKLKSFDILHVFGSVKDCLGIIEVTKNIGVKVVISPIFWSTLNRALHEYGSLIHKTQLVFRHFAKVLTPVLPSERRKMFLLADVLLPNSWQELEQIARLFAIKRAKMHVVYLGADEKFAHTDSREFVDKYGIRDFILSVGRIEPRKNQLNLIKALRGIGMPLVIIGDSTLEHQRYYEICKRTADKNTIFIGRLEHNNSLLASAYAACRVFVLPGWFETPGLVALEAGLAGAQLAVTDGGSTKEYFKDYVSYFDPASKHSIRVAVEQALRRRKEEMLKMHIRNNFLWRNSVEETIKVYTELLSC